MNWNRELFDFLCVICFNNENIYVNAMQQGPIKLILLIQMQASQ